MQEADLSPRMLREVINGSRMAGIRSDSRQPIWFPVRNPHWPKYTCEKRWFKWWCRSHSLDSGWWHLRRAFATLQLATANCCTQWNVLIQILRTKWATGLWIPVAFSSAAPVSTRFTTSHRSIGACSRINSTRCHLKSGFPRLQRPNKGKERNEWRKYWNMAQNGLKMDGARSEAEVINHFCILPMETITFAYDSSS